MATIRETTTAPATGKMPAAEAAGKASGQQSAGKCGAVSPAVSGGHVRAYSGRDPGGRSRNRSRLEGQTQRIVSGPFTLWNCYAEVSLPLSAKRYLVVFCLDGSVKLHFGSFDFTLEPGSAAAVDGCLLRECTVEVGTVLLEYRPRDSRYHVCRSQSDGRAFLTIPVTDRLVGWARQVAWDIREGVLFDRYDFCSVSVQLRNLSGGGIPYPFSCSGSCPAWGRCAGTAGYEGPPSDSDTVLVTETTGQWIVTVIVAAAGIGLWGGLLVYFLLRDGAALLGAG